MPEDSLQGVTATPADHTTTLLTLRNTSLACILGGVLTLPFDRWQQAWQTQALAYWAAEHEKREWRTNRKRWVSPFVRLVLHEVSLEGVNQLYSNTTTTTTTGSTFLPEISAGILSGVTMALLLCPLETQRAMVRAQQEQATSKLSRFIQAVIVPLTASFSSLSSAGSTNPLQHQIGSINPKERLQRAYKGVGLLALREVVFNVTFFPLAAYLKTQHLQIEPSTQSHQRLQQVVAANMLAGSVCSLLVLPLDVAKTYLWYSGQRWSFWSGRRIVAPPLGLLTRGWTIQALVLGPAFGLVASIYDMT